MNLARIVQDVVLIVALGGVLYANYREMRNIYRETEPYIQKRLRK